jgi:hypothetical protein
MKLGALTLLAVLMLTAQAVADSHSCPEPVKPECIGRLEGIHDKSALTMCSTDLDDYRKQIQDYLKCLDDSRSEVTDKFNKAVKRFNCYSIGNSTCD